MQIKSITLEELASLCKEYDLVHGCYPESFNEGSSVYKFIMEKLGVYPLDEWCVDKAGGL